MTTLWSVACSGGGKDSPADSPGTGSPAPSSVENSHPAAEVQRWHIVPGRSADSLTATSSEAELQQRYGKAAVQSDRIQLGEGETTPGSVLFPADSLHRLEIVWHDTVTRSRPARLILHGSVSEWTVGPGISLGTSLQDLERLNRQPFTLAGFGWDYAGVITDWRGGALDSMIAGAKLYLEPAPGQSESAAYAQVLGDRDYSSSLQPMQQLNPRVGTIFVDFE
jgi:hypothetical protein